MAEDLFEGLPAPSAVQRPPPPPPSAYDNETCTSALAPPLPPAPAPVIKSALKRDKAPEPVSDVEAPAKKRLRFKTTVDASETQIIEAMQKIAAHIKNASKFSKASKLALQLIQAGSIKAGTSDHFFAILDAAMSSSNSCNEASVRADYHALFSAAQDAAQFFNKYQKNRLAAWVLKAVTANDLYTDDSFVFSKAAGKIKEAIAGLPPATADDDEDEAAALAKADNAAAAMRSNDLETGKSAVPMEENKDTSDPFGLNGLLPTSSKTDVRVKAKEVATSNRWSEDEESKRFLKDQREALLSCLEIAARRYRVPWCQTVIDILVKHAFDHVDRFTTKQRNAIDKLWASVREQQIRRKQGKSVTGKLDMNAFEWLQEKYANEKISIRHAVGGGGERRAQQWLG